MDFIKKNGKYYFIDNNNQHHYIPHSLYQKITDIQKELQQLKANGFNNALINSFAEDKNK